MATSLPIRPRCSSPTPILASRNGPSPTPLASGRMSPRFPGSYVGLTGVQSGSTVSLYATTGTSAAGGRVNGNSLVADTFTFNSGMTGTGTFGTPITLATAGADDGFAGVAFTPAATSANPPTVAKGGGTATYTIGGSAATVDSGVTMSTTESDGDITGAVMELTNYQTGDTLNFSSPTDSVTGSWNAVNDSLVLSGTTSAANYQAAMRTVTFSTTNNTVTTPRTISVQGSDTFASPTTGNSVTETVDVDLAPPSVTSSGSRGPIHGRGQRGDGRPWNYGHFAQFRRSHVFDRDRDQRHDDDLAGHVAIGRFAQFHQRHDHRRLHRRHRHAGIDRHGFDHGRSIPDGLAERDLLLRQHQHRDPLDLGRGGRLERQHSGHGLQHGQRHGRRVRSLGSDRPVREGDELGHQLLHLPVQQRPGQHQHAYLGLCPADRQPAVEDPPLGQRQRDRGHVQRGSDRHQHQFADSVGGHGWLDADGDRFQPIELDHLRLDVVDLADQEPLGDFVPQQRPDRLAWAHLSGNWTNGTSTFPSGNGLAGTGTSGPSSTSDFNFLFNSLPGDAVRGGSIVNSTDYLDVRAKNNTSYTSTNYNPYYDVAGAGIINSTDYLDVRARNNNSLPSNAPGPQTSGVGSLGSDDAADVGGAMLAVQEGSTSQTGATPATAGSNQTSGGSSSGSSTSGSSTSSSSGSSGSSATSSSSSSSDADATDEAISEFDLADLWA